MTVAELMQALTAYPPGAEVYVMDFTYGAQSIARVEPDHVEPDRDQDPVLWQWQGLAHRELPRRGRR